MHLPGGDSCAGPGIGLDGPRESFYSGYSFVGTSYLKKVRLQEISLLWVLQNGG